VSTGFLRPVAILTAVALAVLGLSVGQALAAGTSTPSGHRAGLGKPWQPPAATADHAGNLPTLNPAGGGGQLGVTAAVKSAEASGHPVVASALTTPTQLVTARPDGSSP
jgi:hypothetical protein